MMKPAFSLVFMMLSAGPAMAAMTCENAMDFLPVLETPFVSLELVRPVLGESTPLRDAKTPEKFAAYVEEIHQQMASGSILIPSKVKILLSADGSNAYANDAAMEIYVSERFYANSAQGREMPQNPRWMKGIFDHEFFHLVFSLNMGRIDSEFAALMPRLIDFNEKRKEISRRSEENMRKRFSITDYTSPEIDILDKQSDQIHEEMMNNFKAREEWLASTAPGRRYQLANAYNEFFADVGAVMISGKPNEVYNALDMKKSMSGASTKDRASEILDAKMRAFDDHVHIRRGTLAREEHMLFWQVRQMVWDEYFSRPTILREKKSEVLEGILRAIAKELAWMEENKIDPMQNQELANERLMQAIRREVLL